MSPKRLHRLPMESTTNNNNHLDVSQRRFTTEQTSNTLALLSRLNTEVANDYAYSDGISFSCHLIAFKLAKRLVQEGKRPEIKGFQNAKGEALYPLRYSGRVEFGTHNVTVCDGLCYDPIEKEPIPEAEYGEKVFGVKVKVKRIENTAEGLQKRYNKDKLSR